MRTLQELQKLIVQQKAACDAMSDEKDKLVNELQQVCLHTHHIIQHTLFGRVLHFTKAAYTHTHNCAEECVECTVCMLYCQELKSRDDQYVKYLKKQAEEVDLVLERMEEQGHTLLKAHRQEMSQIESSFATEREALKDAHKLVQSITITILW